VISGNVFSGNRQDGLEVWGTGNTIRANSADDNGNDGITAGMVPEGTLGVGNTYQGNSAFGNGGFDLADYPPGPCILNTWIANRGVKLYNGCEDGD
jgi:parallel beta-helix repeat protein